MRTYSSILAQSIPWSEELGGLQSMGLDITEVTQRIREKNLKISYVYSCCTLETNTMLQISQTSMKDARDAGSIPGSGGANGNPLQYFCLGNPMDREVCRLQRSHKRVGQGLATETTIIFKNPFLVAAAAAAAAKSLQQCPTLCDPRDSSPQGSLVPGILQARTLE